MSWEGGTTGGLLTPTIDRLPPLRQHYLLLREKNRRADRRACEGSFAEFVKRAWPYVEPNDELDWNWHLDAKCVHLQAVSAGRIQNLIINEPPGYAKSLIVSVLWPAWEWGPAGRPELRWMASSYSSDISIRDSIRCRNLIECDWYQERWGETVRLIKRNETRLETAAGGFRVASSVGGLSTGERVHRSIHDDLLRANDEHSKAMREQAVQHLRAMATRAVDPADYHQVLIMQRLHEEDPAGWLLKEQPGRWEQLRMPAKYEGPQKATSIGWTDPRTKEGEALWPNRYPTKSINEIAGDLGEWRAAGQLQQLPQPAGGGILRKRWWHEWPANKPLPIMDHVYCSWDTAYSEEDLKENSCSAMLELGIWWNEYLRNGRGGHCAMLLSAWDGRVDYPDLKLRALDIDKVRAPDRHLIEKKASGQSLIQDMRRARISVFRYNPDRDKVARAYAVQSVLKNGQVWYPEGKAWALRVIDAVSSFPFGLPPSSDYTDCLTQGLLYMLHGWWLESTDDPEDVEIVQPKRRRLYG